MTGQVIRCHCPRCAGCTYLLLSTWLAAHPEHDRPEQLELELVEAVERHPSGPRP